MPMFRKKPVVVEAVNWIEMPRKEFEAWCPAATCRKELAAYAAAGWTVRKLGA